MKFTDKTIVIALPILAVLAGFWLLVISPKREEVAELDKQAAELQTSISGYEQQAAAGEAARQGFPSAYHRLIVLGKAAPEGGEQPALLVGVDHLADQADIAFDSIVLDASSTGAPAPAPAPREAPAPEPSEGSSAEASTAAETTTPVPATEASAATLPLGAQIGPAGLGVMRYDLQFRGGFFDVSSFLRETDRLVRFTGGKPVVQGRLLTIDGFSLTGDKDRGFPALSASFRVSSYLTPEGETVTLGASPAGPAPAPAGEAVVPTSTAVTP